MLPTQTLQNTANGIFHTLTNESLAHGMRNKILTASSTYIYKIMFISTGIVNKQDIFHPWKAVSVCVCKLATTTKSMSDDPNEHQPSEIPIVITFCFRKESLFFTSLCKLLSLLWLYFSALDKNTCIIHPFVSCLWNSYHHGTRHI